MIKEEPDKGLMAEPDGVMQFTGDFGAEIEEDEDAVEGIAADGPGEGGIAVGIADIDAMGLNGAEKDEELGMGNGIHEGAHIVGIKPADVGDGGKEMDVAFVVMNDGVDEVEMELIIHIWWDNITKSGEAYQRP
jgi:hypothetical protein